MNNNFYTYAYLRENGTPYYIGKGKFREKMTQRINSKNKKINLPEENRRLILKTFELEEDAFRHEVYMISIFGRKDIGTGILRNMTDGGEGASGRVLSQQHKDRISKANSGMKRTDEFRYDARERAKGNKNRRKKCVYRGIEFESQTKAAEYFGLSEGTIHNHLKKGLG
jgi:hypothetical protein